MTAIPERYRDQWPDTMGVQDTLKGLDLGAEYVRLAVRIREEASDRRETEVNAEAAPRDLYDAGRCLAVATAEVARFKAKRDYWMAQWGKDALETLVSEIASGKIKGKRLSDDMVDAYIRIEKGDELRILDEEYRRAEMSLSEWGNLHAALRERCHTLRALVEKGAVQ